MTLSVATQSRMALRELMAWARGRTRASTRGAASVIRLWAMSPICMNCSLPHGERRIDALPHLHLRDRERDLAVLADANEGVRREIPVRLNRHAKDSLHGRESGSGSRA